MAKPMPVSRATFAEKAPPLVVTIAGNQFLVRRNEVTPGKSCGYFLSVKIDVEVDGKMVPCQVGLNVTAIGSKHMEG